MAFGLPIVTLNLHGAKLLVPDKAGIKVTPNEPDQTVEELAKGVQYYYDNPDAREKDGKNGFEFAKTQTWEYKIENISNIYNDLLEKNK